METTWQEPLAVPKSWELSLADNQQEKGCLLTIPTRNSILGINWINFKKDPELQCGQPLSVAKRHPEPDPSKIQFAWTPNPWKLRGNKYVLFQEAKFVVIWCVAIETNTFSTYYLHTNTILYILPLHVFI